MRYWYCIDNDNTKWLYKGTVQPIQKHGNWLAPYNGEEEFDWMSDEDMISQFGASFLETLPDISANEIVEIQLEVKAKKCE